MISDGNKFTEVNLFKMTKLSLKDFTQKYDSKEDTLNEYQLQKLYKYPICPRDSKLLSDKSLLNIDNGCQGGTHWCCFSKRNKPYYFELFGGQPDTFLLNQLPKPIMYHIYEIQDIISE